VQKPAILQVRHHVTNRCSAQRLLEAFRNSARGDGLARLDVRAHDVRQDLAVTTFLERRIPHSSTLLLVLKSATYIVESVSSGVNVSRRTQCRKCWKGRIYAASQARPLQLAVCEPD